MSPRAGYVPNDIATHIEKTHAFAKDDTGRLYVYKNGVYIPGGEDVVRAEDWGFFEEKGRTDAWKRGEALDVLERIRIKARKLWPMPSIEVLCVQNGLLDLKTRKLTEHTPEHLSTIQLPVLFDPEASCPAWDKFLSEVSPGNEDLLREIAGSLLVPESSVQCIVLLWGPGGNGKSTLLAALEALVGHGNTSHVSLQELAKDGFASSQIYGKLANICGDLPLEGVNDTGLIKRLTGGDYISAQFKNKDRFEFKSFAMQIFSANQFVKVKDSSIGFWDRMVIVPMERCFRKSDAEVSQHELLSRLQEPQELAGAFNKALAGLDRLKRNKRFSEPPRSRELLDEMRGQLSPVQQFLRDETRVDPAGRIEPGELLERFNTWAKDKGYALKTPSQFGKELAEASPNLGKSRRGPKNAQKAFYEGIALNRAA